MGIRVDYQDRIAAGSLKPDPAQSATIDVFERLSVELERAASRNGGFFARLRKNGSSAPKGIYLWGAVGRGKTMLMDLFYQAVEAEPKHRVHFHAFMQDVHARLYGARKTHKAEDAIAEVAREIGSEARLLCLDEMQIADIADAMIIGRLFEALMSRGTVIVTTSNTPPDELYREGLNRDLFLPFIRLMEEKLDVVSLDSPTDYRLGRVKGRRTFVTPLGAQADAHVQELWEKLTDTPKGAPATLDVLGRRLAVPETAHGAARLAFAALCEAPLGAPDYLALARAFSTIFIEHIPVIGASQRNAAKRFILLIDTLYDAHTRLVASAEREPGELYDGNDHRLEFARTVSRLEEMQSASWWGARIAET